MILLQNDRAVANTRTLDHAAHLRRVAEGWCSELRDMGIRPRSAPRRSAWDERQTAIAGAMSLADAIEAEARQQAAQAAPAAAPIRERVTALRLAGLTFAAVAQVVGVPIGTVKTLVRRSRLQAVTA